MPRGRARLADQKDAAEHRFAQYQRELRDLLTAADGSAARGLWDEAANKLTAAGATVTAMTGVARELRLIYTMMED